MAWRGARDHVAETGDESGSAESAQFRGAICLSSGRTAVPGLLVRCALPYRLEHHTREALKLVLQVREISL